MKSEVEVRVPKDIRGYKTKIIGSLTLRQLICIAVAVAVDIFAYSFVLSSMNLDKEVLFYVLIFVDLPILLFMTEPSGMPFEIYLKEVVFRMFFYPRYRRIATKLGEKKDDSKQVRSKKETKNLMKQHPEMKVYK